MTLRERLVDARTQLHEPVACDECRRLYPLVDYAIAVIDEDGVPLHQSPLHMLILAVIDVALGADT